MAHRTSSCNLQLYSQVQHARRPLQQHHQALQASPELRLSKRPGSILGQIRYSATRKHLDSPCTWSYSQLCYRGDLPYQPLQLFPTPCSASVFQDSPRTDEYSETENSCVEQSAQRGARREMIVEGGTMRQASTSISSPAASA